MTKAITAIPSIIDAPACKLNPNESNRLCRSCRNSPHVAEGVDEVRIDRHQFGVRMLFAHHLEHDLLSMLADIDQYQILAGHQVVVKLGELLMLAVDSHEAAFPGAEQRGRSDQDGVNERRHHMNAERLRVHEQSDPRQTNEKSQRGADEPVAHDIQGFEVVAGMDLMPLETRVVAANDVQVEIIDADRMQIGRHLIGRCYGGSEKINAFHGLPPRHFLRRPMNEFSAPNTFPAPPNLLRSATAAFSVAQALLRWKMCIRVSLVHCGMKFSPHAALETTRANIECGADKSCPGRRSMDLFVVVIIAAMLFTVATVFLGVLTMSAGGSTDKALSTPLMWTRVGCQAVMLLLLLLG